MVGRRLAHYEIQEHLGSGGMGDVYRATDTKLRRSVALKFLRDDVAADPGRAARFQREAKALAALNHPHIAAIHGQEDADGRTFLVMEFVAGKTLDERINGHPLPLSEAVSTALQIIEAVEAAHNTGIIHRDLKPANIKITPEGRVKVLDFGLATATTGDSDAVRPGGHQDLETVTVTSSGIGVIVGTPAYMSPEQAAGLRVDRRTDVFAFGCVLFEMLTGHRAFTGSSSADVISRVLQRDPDWRRLPSTLPPALDRLLRLCLEKNPRQRRQTAGDVRIDLENALSEPPAIATVGRWRAAHLIGIAAILLAFTAFNVWALLRERGAEARVIQTEIVTPHTIDPMHFALSPDAAYLVFAAPASDGVERLHLRALSSPDAQPMPGTENARYPFWSPNSKSIGFFANRKLFVVDVAGGSPRPLALAANPMGGSWGSDGTILFAPTTVSPLFRVSASGGKSVAATTLHLPQSNHRRPSFLPDGRRFLFYAVAAQVTNPGDPDESGVYLASLDGGTPTRLIANASAAVFVPPDRIMFVQERKLIARRIDVSRGELAGDPVVVAEPVSESVASLGWFSASATGAIAYRSGTAAPLRTTWFDRTGKVLLSDDIVLNAPALSRDGRFAAGDRTVNMNRDVWILDLSSRGFRPLTHHPLIDGHPVWSPNGSIAFHTQRHGTFDILKTRSSGEGEEEVVLQTPANEWPLDWSIDGRYLLYQTSDENYAASDLLALPMTGTDRTPVPIAADSRFEERIGSFSPDSRHVVYETDETGRPEVMIKTFPPSGPVIRVSTTGGSAPRWSAGASGEEIFFVAPDGKMMTASVSYTGSTLSVGPATVLFATSMVAQVFTFQYAVSRDARSFLINNRDVERASAPPIKFLQNWKPGD